MIAEREFLSFKDDMKKFDLLLAPGQQFIDRLQKNRSLLQTRTEIVGYPKFDITLQQPTKKIFDNDNPVILYAPHFKSDRSSLLQWGSYVLDYFYPILDIILYNIYFLVFELNYIFLND